jgi:hypothetical protein
MEWSLGSFGDLRLDKGGLRSSNGWSRARQCACAALAVSAVAKLRATEHPEEGGRFLATPSDGGEAGRGLAPADRCCVRRAACAGDPGHYRDQVPTNAQRRRERQTQHRDHGRLARGGILCLPKSAVCPHMG